jgi:hypothetical protein
MTLVPLFYLMSLMARVFAVFSIGMHGSGVVVYV